MPLHRLSLLSPLLRASHQHLDLSREWQNDPYKLAFHRGVEKEILVMLWQGQQQGGKAVPLLAFMKLR